jgi:hypothetical protein
LIRYLGKRRNILLIGAVVMLVTTIPYLIGYAFQGNGWLFTGFLMGVEDGNSYIAKMLSGSSGNWLFRSPYSAEPQVGFLAFFPYILLGKLTGGQAQHEQLVALFHIYRVLAGLLVTLALYDFISLFIKKPIRQMMTLSVILLGGGLGWILAVAEMKHLMDSIPLDFLSPESFGFLGLFGLPHLTLARALLFWGVVKYLEGENTLAAGVLWLLMGFFQPMYTVIIWVVIAFQAIVDGIWHQIKVGGNTKEWRFRTSLLRKALIAGLVSSPIVLYTAVILYVNPYLAAWTSQNNLPSPHWSHYFIAYGVVLPFAVGGIVKIFQSNHRLGGFLACWVIAFPLLVSAPVPTQRRLAEGIWVILVTAFFVYFSDRDRLPLYGKILIGLLFPTTIIILWGASLRAGVQIPPVFIAEQKIDAYLSLGELAPRNSLVLSSFSTGNSLPAWVPISVVQGHGPETVHLEQLQLEIDRYFILSQGTEECGGFFQEKGIDFLFWGPEEEALWLWDPDLKSCLNEVYNANGYKIFEVAD